MEKCTCIIENGNFIWENLACPIHHPNKEKDIFVCFIHKWDTIEGTSPCPYCQLAAKEAELEQEKESRRGNKQAVVDTVGGLVEGKPTNILNYLQRLRELMNKEMELSIERKRADEFQERLDSLTWDFDWWEG